MAKRKQADLSWLEEENVVQLDGDDIAALRAYEAGWRDFTEGWWNRYILWLAGVDDEEE